MNQNAVYEILNNSNCTIISFEDLPSISGSWRVAFFHLDHLCEVTSNRRDRYIYLSSKKNNSESKNKTIRTEKKPSDEEELSILVNWIRFSF